MHWGWLIFSLILILIIAWILWGGENLQMIGYRGLDFNFTPQLPPSIPLEKPEPPTQPPPPRWKHEQIACQAISEIYGVPFTSVRPDFLKNPETGQSLEIDCYNHDLKIGVEYNGEQHYVFPNYFHKNDYSKFMKQLRRDQFKVEMCDRLGIYLITVPYNVPANRIKDYIDYYRPESVQQRLAQNGARIA